MRQFVIASLFIVGALSAAGCIYHSDRGDLDCVVQVVDNTPTIVCIPVR